MRSRPKILIMCPDATDACSWYRGWGPWTAMRQHFDVELVLPGRVSWTDVRACDIVYYIRPFGHPNDLEICTMVKELNRKLWVDLDDDFFNIPTDNRAHHILVTEHAVNRLRGVLYLADKITVTTPEIIQSIVENMHLTKGIERRCEVVPNAFDDSLFTFPETKPLGAGMKKHWVIWRGSESYNLDMIKNFKGVKRFSDTRADVRFLLWGYTHWVWSELGGKALSMKAVNFPEYLSTSQKNAIPVHLKMLLDNRFNRSKSNSGWIEQTFAGAITVAPKLPEWEKIPCVVYEPENAESLEQALSYSFSEDVQDKLWKESRELILHEYMLTKINGLRYRILTELMGQ